MISELLPIGKENKISAAELMRVTGIHTKRELSKHIRKERCDGRLILSTKADGGGYYLPGDAAEVQEFIDTFASEAKALFYMLKVARQYNAEGLP